MFGNQEQRQEAIKINLPNLKDGSSALQTIANTLQEIQKAKIPLDAIRSLVDNLNDVAKAVNEIMIGLRLDSKLPETVIDKELSRIKSELDFMDKAVEKYDKIKAKLTGIKVNKDKNGNEVKTFKKNTLINTAKDVVKNSLDLQDEKDLKHFQDLEKELVDFIKLGGDLDKVTIKVGDRAISYFQVIQTMFMNFGEYLKKPGSGGLLDYLKDYFNVGRNPQGNRKLLSQIIDENSEAKKIEQLQTEEKYYQKQLEFASARTTKETEFIAKVKEAGTATGETGGKVTAVAEFSETQLAGLINNLRAVVEWLEKINISLGDIGTKASILQNVSSLYDVEKQTEVDEITESIEDKNKQYANFLELLNKYTQTILSNMADIQIKANELDLSNLFKNFNVGSKQGSPEEIANALTVVQEAVKGIQVGKSYADENAEALKRLAEAYKQYKQLGGQELIDTLAQSRPGAANRIKDLLAKEEKVSIPVDIVPHLADDFETQLKQLITEKNISVPITVQPELADIVNSFINPISEAVKGNPVEVEIKALTEKFIQDIQKVLNESAQFNNIEQLHKSLEDGLKSRNIPIEFQPDVEQLIQKIQTALDKHNFNSNIKPILAQFKKDIQTFLDNQNFKVHITPSKGKFKQEAQEKIDSDKLKINISPNNLKEFLDTIQKYFDTKTVRVNLDPIVTGFVKKAQEKLKNVSIPVNFTPGQAILKNASNAKPLTNAEIQRRIKASAGSGARITTTRLGQHITSARAVVTNADGSKTTHTLDQYGNQRKTDQTADKAKQVNDEYKHILKNYNTILRETKRQEAFAFNFKDLNSAIRVCHVS